MERTLPAPVRKRNLVIPNGVDTELFTPVDRATARERLGWPAEELVALFAADPGVGRKNFDLARDACEEARSRGVDLRLHIGTDVDPPLMPTLMSASDCLILTSTAEGSPNVVKEAMACGLPVVATDVGDVRQQLADVTRSRVVANATADDLAAALADVLGEPVRSGGREAALARLDQRLIATRVLQLYAEGCEDGR